MARKQTVTIVGPGSLGGALAVGLYRVGFPISEIVYRTDRSRAKTIAKKCGEALQSGMPVPHFVSFEDAAFSAEIVWLCVGDGAIAPTVEAMRDRTVWKGKIVFHASGALSSDELLGLRRKGASVASVHPMMSFVRASEASFKGVSFALQGDAAATKVAATIAKALGGVSFELKKKDKALYHALGAFSSPLLVAQLAAMERIGKELGLKPEQTRRVIGPILRKTLENYLAQGAAAAFSGPLIRGDVRTVGSNLKALHRVPGTVEIYRALARMATEDLPVKNKKEIRKLLK